MATNEETQPTNDPPNILHLAYERAMGSIDTPLVSDARIAEDIDYVCRCPSNRAGVRMLMACLLASLHNPKVDIRKPFTPIGDDDVYSGRDYDQDYVSPFVIEHQLPVNSTTSFLTPGYRTNPIVLERGAKLTGRPKNSITL